MWNPKARAGLVDELWSRRGGWLLGLADRTRDLSPVNRNNINYISNKTNSLDSWVVFENMFSN